MDTIIIVDQCCAKFACVKVPQFCPKCKQRLNGNPPPVMVTNPFITRYKPMCVLLKPTDGIWMDNCDFHVGLTCESEEKLLVTGFDHRGILQEAFTEWQGSIVLYEVNKSDQVVCGKIWRAILMTMFFKLGWSPLQYNQLDRNCLDFVIAFLSHYYKACEKVYSYKNIFKDLSRQNFIDKYVISCFKNATFYLKVKELLSKDSTALL